MRLKWYLAFQIPPRLGTQTTASASAERKPRGVPQDLSMTAKIPASEFHKDPIPISLLARKLCDFPINIDFSLVQICF